MNTMKSSVTVISSVIVLLLLLSLFLYQIYQISPSNSNSTRNFKYQYESLCNGEGQASQLGTSCKYVTKGDHPYLLIGPLKEERVNIKPAIYFYHDLMFDSEIQVIQALASPRLSRSRIHNSAGQLVASSYRISQSASIHSNDHPVVEKVNRRIALATGLDLSTAEPLKVVNYGLGGQYGPHYDFAKPGLEFPPHGTGNRIATLLIYISNVEAGGATVFPKAGRTIWPEKGSAVFWFNLHDHGSRDTLTLHAACPVLSGSKWVANKWIHERGQEFKRPCTLKH